MAQMREHWSSIFGHFMAVADRGDLAEVVKTADLHADIKDEQIAKLKALRSIPGDILEMPRGGFVARYKADDKFYICLHVENLSTEERHSLEAELAKFGAVPELLDESTFMFLSHEYRELFVPKKKFLAPEAAISLLGIADEGDYNGHQIGDLINLYSDVMILTVDDASILTNSSKWFIAALVTVSAKPFRSEAFPEALATKLSELLLLRNTNPENIYYAATSIHLRQCYMEIYRCIEGAFYLPWVSALKTSLNIAGSSRSLATHLKSSIGWRQKERESISKLFAMVSPGASSGLSLLSVEAFKDMDLATATPDSISRRLYKIRNVLVHQEDFDDPTPMVLTGRCWPALNLFLAGVAIDLYSRFPSELDYSYDDA